MKRYSYYRLHISLKGQREKLFREVLFPERGTLDALAVTIISIFNTYQGEIYEFSDKTRRYYCQLPSRTNKTRVAVYGVRLTELNLQDNTFTMDYFRDSFVIEILDTVTYERRFQIPRVISGAGYGVATEGMNFLNAYLDGYPIPRPITFWNSGKATALDFTSFSLDDCNQKLHCEFSHLTNYYDTYLS